MNHRMLPVVLNEVDATRRYLRRKASGLGTRFLADLRETIERIVLRPDAFPKLETLPESSPYRRARLKVFPYLVVFKALPDEVLIVAVYHARRRPNYWFNRRHEP